MTACLFYACKRHFSSGFKRPPFEHPPRENMVKLYQVQCSNESLSMWLLSLCNSIIRCLGTIILFCIYNMYCD